MLGDLFNILIPVVLVAATGFVWTKQGLPFDDDFVSRLNFNVATPLLIFSSLTKLRVEWSAMGEVAGAALLSIAVVAIAGAGLLMLFRIPLRPYLSPVLFANTGNTGLPVCYLAFGDKGLALAVIVHVIGASLQFTLGVAMAAGKFSLIELTRVPLLYAVAAAAIVVGFNLTLPLWITNTVTLLGQIAIPLMLLALGASLVKLKVTALGRSVLIALMRLILGLGASASAVWLLGLSHDQAGVVLLQLSMPSAVFTYLLAARYRSEPEGVAGAVFVSTLLGFAALPFILLLVL